MMRLFLIHFVTMIFVLPALSQKEISLSNFEHYPGYVDFYWDDESGKVYLDITSFDEEFLYSTALSAGVGSNDIGLDRGQLGGEHVVTFTRIGNKILLKEKNLGYRADSDNIEEQKAVEEAFATSVLWGFTIADTTENGFLVDASKFFLRDVHGVSERLAGRNQGTYKVDPSRCAMNLDRTRNFPQNSEFDVLITLTGQAKGAYIRSVTPSPDVVTVQQHHSFIQLPDDDYQPRAFDPRSGYYPISYHDYATPIDEKIVKRFIRRHRLEKQDPSAESSEAVEPIVYYLDSGTPEPIRSALLEGASWWNQAFEAAGYQNAYRVEIMPADADPMDVRYNVIQWIHRSTRGWSYGSSVIDPRTGEIIKGHVSLGSLRVRQDYLIAQGLLAVFGGGADNSPLVELALARLRQLSAHEVGHTLGLAHNFAASTNQRASVMDYPHPFVKQINGEIDFSEAYDVGIGEWDKRSILYGYQDFPEGVDEAAELWNILSENQEMGLAYISDQDARPASGAHASGHLWDNGDDIVLELQRMIGVRKVALDKFGLDNIPEGTPLGDLENVLVPLYLSHRYQAEAVCKLIGGLEYRYAVRGESETSTKMISPDLQSRALDALISTLDPSFLTLPESIIELIPPQPISYRRDRELFEIRTGLTFDPVSAAESSAGFVVNMLLNPERLGRVVEHHARDSAQPSLGSLLGDVLNATNEFTKRQGLEGMIGEVVHLLVIRQLIALAMNESAHHQVSGEALQLLDEQQKQVANDAHTRKVRHLIDKFFASPEDFQLPPTPDLPAGSPIGCSGIH